MMLNQPLYHQQLTPDQWPLAAISLPVELWSEVLQKLAQQYIWEETKGFRGAGCN